MSQYTIWIEAEYFEEGTWDKYDEFTNVIVEFDNKTRWAAIFETFKNIQTSIGEFQQTGECLGGNYRFITKRILC